MNNKREKEGMKVSQLSDALKHIVMHLYLVNGDNDVWIYSIDLMKWLSTQY